MTKKKKRIIIAILILAILLIVILLLRSCHSGNSPNNEQQPSETKTLDFTPNNYVGEKITIPGITGINLKSGQLEQKVDFSNPADNPCYFQLSLFLSDDTLIWQSEYIAPSEKITDITLNQELQRGVYRHCRLVYDCYSLKDNAKMNGGDVELEINSY